MLIPSNGGATPATLAGTARRPGHPAGAAARRATCRPACCCSAPLTRGRSRRGALARPRRSARGWPRSSRPAGWRSPSERLQRERALLSGIINAVTDPILLTDTEGRIIIANTRAETLLATDDERERGPAAGGGAEQHAVLGRAHPARDRGRRGAAPRGAARRSRATAPTCSSSCSARCRATPARATGIVSILRNVTDLRRATAEIEENYRKLRQTEADARAERDRLDLVIDSVADPILVTDPGGNIVMMNAPGRAPVHGRRRPASDEAQRGVQANDAHFSSFVSNLFFEGGSRATQRQHQPGRSRARARRCPWRPSPARSSPSTARSPRVVTILHDRTEELERARLYEQLKPASAELEAKVREATAELVRQNELLRRSAHRAGAGLGAEVAVPGQHVARVPHAAQRHPRLHEHAAQGRVGGAGGAPAATTWSASTPTRQHLLSIINDILDITRIEAGKMPLTLPTSRSPSWSREVLAEVEPLIARAPAERDHQGGRRAARRCAATARRSSRSSSTC